MNQAEYKKVFEADGTAIEYCLVWEKNEMAIQNPPEISEEDLEKIKNILKENNVFTFNIHLQL